jgi:para-aminobenzoate synthetase component I
LFAQGGYDNNSPLVADYPPSPDSGALFIRMSDQPLRLPLSARQLLLACHYLDTPALLYCGGSGTASTSTPRVILACQPDTRLRADDINTLKHLLTQIISAPQPDNHNRDNVIFRSGWLGYFSYDAGEVLMGLPSRPTRQPLAEFAHYPLSLELCLQTDQCRLYNPLNVPQVQVEQLQQHLADALLAAAQEQSQAQTAALYFATTATSDTTSSTGTNAADTTTLANWQPAWSFERYQQAFDQVQAYLRSGDCYQVNLTMPYHCHQDLRHHNPLALLENFNAPFSCYFRTEDMTLFSVSPERFIRIQDGLMTTSPIKGTAPRGTTPEEDTINHEWLRDSEKNQAENLMIVDLLRNDLGRCAEIGSVRVERLFDIESHANVHHMVSTIVARALRQLHSVDIITSALPGGSITGAPKKRAMEIIQELEAESRGLYCGSFGYFDSSGSCEMNILIRSIQADANGATCWGGGGIVIDSEAASEYQEIQDKIGRLLALPF